MRRYRKPRRPPMAAIDQINVTPLLDLTFLLLIAFMITMPLMEYGTRIDPPAMNSDQLPTEDFKSVTLTREGTILYDRDAVTRDELVEKLRTLKATNSKTSLLLRADGTRSYKDVIELMALIRSSGFADVTLVTQAEDK